MMVDARPSKLRKVVEPDDDDDHEFYRGDDHGRVHVEPPTIGFVEARFKHLLRDAKQRQGTIVSVITDQAHPDSLPPWSEVAPRLKRFYRTMALRAYRQDLAIRDMLRALENVESVHHQPLSCHVMFQGSYSADWRSTGVTYVDTQQLRLAPTLRQNLTSAFESSEPWYDDSLWNATGQILVKDVMGVINAFIGARPDPVPPWLDGLVRPNRWEAAYTARREQACQVLAQEEPPPLPVVAHPEQLIEMFSYVNTMEPERRILDQIPEFIQLNWPAWFQAHATDSIVDCAGAVACVIALWRNSRYCGRLELLWLWRSVPDRVWTGWNRWQNTPGFPALCQLLDELVYDVRVNWLLAAMGRTVAAFALHPNAWSCKS